MHFDFEAFKDYKETRQVSKCEFPLEVIRV